MAYPTIDKPYGLKPVNLVGGRVFSGSTRMIPIKQAYNANIYNGDAVAMTAAPSTGTVTVSALAYNSSTPLAGQVGVFLGCEYSPVSGPIFGKQRNQYWPAATASQDAVAYVADDPGQLFKAVCLAQSSGGASNSLTAVGYVSPAFVGSNLALAANGSGAVATGDSLAGLTSATAPTNGSGILRATASTVGPFRVVELVKETAVTLQGSGTISTTTVTLAAAVTGLQAGMQIIVLNTAGTGYTTAGYPGDYNYVTNVNGTTVTIATAITAASAVTILFVGYPEVIVGWAGVNHAYLNGTGV